MAGDPTAKQDKFVELQEKKAEERKAEASTPAEEKKAEQLPAKKEKAARAEKKEAAKEEKQEKKREVVLERVYTADLTRAYAKPQMMRANYATRMLRAFLVRHMKSSADKIRIAPALNDSIRWRGSGHPVKKLKFKATKDKDGIVLAEPAA